MVNNPIKMNKIKQKIALELNEKELEKQLKRDKKKQKKDQKKAEKKNKEGRKEVCFTHFKLIIHIN